MLCELRVRNLALIEFLDLEFDQDIRTNLVVMTGETGAGKSIMLRAIHLLAGKRGAGEWIREGKTECVVEALFEISESHHVLRKKVGDAGFESGNHLVIKRVLHRKGRSRYYVNSSLATGKIVAELMAELINVASQHDQQQLLHPSAHLDFIDTLGDLWDQREKLKRLRRDFLEEEKMLSLLQKREQEKVQRQDFLRFQLQEIDEASPILGEDEELAAEKKRLKNGQQLISISQESHRLLSGPLLDGLTKLRQNMVQIAEYDTDAIKLTEDISGFTFLAEDYVQELRQYRDGLESDPFRLDQVNERLHCLQQLKRKYGSRLEDVLGFAEAGRVELAQLDNMDKEIQERQKRLAELEQELFKQADVLTEGRRAVARRLEKAMVTELSSLAFDCPSFKVHWEETARAVEEIRDSGWERGEFYFSANQGEQPRPLAKIASGGELSRLMLGMKCLLARKDMVETVIFDEIDTGIGGEAAEAVARKIQELAGHHQVFCITHLPQIACRGSMHLLVSKNVEGGRTRSAVALLSESGRVRELERMLAGESATTQTRAWAKELLEKGKAV